jgi:polyisoprenoid-binding protein YceI
MKSLLIVSALLFAAASQAAPVTYNVDPAHTYPNFEADHMGGLSVWRGKFKTSSGTIVYDKEGKAGTVDITVDATSLDFGHDGMTKHASGSDMFDVEKFPTMRYTGKLMGFKKGNPTFVDGSLTLKGVTKPVKLNINQFKCMINPMSKKEVCGADASATFNRGDFGMDFGKQFGFNMAVKLLISVEAGRTE